jgi:hypothetical protein
VSTEPTTPAPTPIRALDPEKLGGPSLVAIDGDPDNGGAFLAYISPTRWNGWACPYFAEDAVRAMAATFEHEDGSPALALDGEGAALVVTITNGPSGHDADGTPWEPQTILPVDIGGAPYWCVGGWSWVWSEVSDTSSTSSTSSTDDDSDSDSDSDSTE